jgi:hypothetical protein
MTEVIIQFKRKIHPPPSSAEFCQRLNGNKVKYTVNGYKIKSGGVIELNFPDRSTLLVERDTVIGTYEPDTKMDTTQ